MLLPILRIGRNTALLLAFAPDNLEGEAGSSEVVRYSLDLLFDLGVGESNSRVIDNKVGAHGVLARDAVQKWISGNLAGVKANRTSVSLTILVSDRQLGVAIGAIENSVVDAGSSSRKRNCHSVNGDRLGIREHEKLLMNYSVIINSYLICLDVISVLRPRICRGPL
jgi:hypothetical protein